MATADPLSAGSIHRAVAALPQGGVVYLPPGDYLVDSTIRLPSELVDTSGEDDVHLVEPRYHLGPKKSLHLVYNEFGRDLIDALDGVGFTTESLRLESPSREASRVLTLCSVKR